MMVVNAFFAGGVAAGLGYLEGCTFRSVQALADSEKAKDLVLGVAFSVFILQIQAYFNGAFVSLLDKALQLEGHSTPKPSQFLSFMDRMHIQVICPVAPWSSCDSAGKKVASIQCKHASTATRTCRGVANKGLFLALLGITPAKRPNLAGFPCFHTALTSSQITKVHVGVLHQFC